MYGFILRCTSNDTGQTHPDVRARAAGPNANGDHLERLVDLTVPAPDALSQRPGQQIGKCHVQHGAESNELVQ
jgi:hypothetical protein